MSSTVAPLTAEEARELGRADHPEPTDHHFMSHVWRAIRHASLQGKHTISLSVHDVPATREEEIAAALRDRGFKAAVERAKLVISW